MGSPCRCPQGDPHALALTSSVPGESPAGLAGWLEVLEQQPSERVAWKVVDGPQEWIGTTIDWQLRQDGDQTIVLFKHQGWKEPVEFMHHCSTKGATDLMSLKSLVETDDGAPAPRDVHIAFTD